MTIIHREISIIHGNVSIIHDICIKKNKLQMETLLIMRILHCFFYEELYRCIQNYAGTRLIFCNKSSTNIGK